MPLVDIERRRAYSKAYFKAHSTEMSLNQKRFLTKNPNAAKNYTRKSRLVEQEIKRLFRCLKAFK
jgi:hypothetical protein